MGCGSDNPAGLAMDVQQDGAAATTQIVFDRRHVGAPGLAHGGAVAAACDDLFGFVLYLVGQPAVTRSFEVGYRAPVRLDTHYRIRAWLEHRDARRLHMIAEGADPEGTVCFDARSVFVVVPLSQFQRYGNPQFGHLKGLD